MILRLRNAKGKAFAVGVSLPLGTAKAFAQANASRTPTPTVQGGAKISAAAIIAGNLGDSITYPLADTHTLNYPDSCKMESC
jgi:hypothetical protein